MNRSWRTPLLIAGSSLAHALSAQCPGVLPAFSWHSNGNAVVFQDQTTIACDSIFWDLGDGTELNSEASVSHIYDVAAVDTVRLTLKKSGCTFVTTGLVAHGGDTEVCNDAITSDFSYGQTGNNEVAFSDQSDAAGANVISYWNFGDGFVDLAFSPTHFYIYPGAYDVSHSIVTVDQQFTTACTAGYARKLLVRGNTSTCGTSVFLNLSVSVDQQNVTATADAVPLTSGMTIGDLVWDFGDGESLISGAGDQFHTYSAGGEFLVCVTAYALDSMNEECNATACEPVSITAPLTSTSELTAPVFLVAPNPMRDHVVVSGRIEVGMEWSLLDGTGRALQAGRFPQSGQQFLHFDELPAGYYSLRIANAFSTHCVRLIKQ